MDADNEQLERAKRELSRMRRRWLLAAEHERSRIERDLHDGAQQRLIAARIKLSLLQERADAAGDPLGRELAALGDQVERAIEDLRALAHGLYPPGLHSVGVESAVANFVVGMPVTVRIRGSWGRRLSPNLESAVYFCCTEALQNVTKHAGMGARVDVTFDMDGEDGVRFEIADDGCGFDLLHLTQSRGITDMRDRLAAINGELTIQSAPGAGTTISGRLPIRDVGELAQPGLNGTAAGVHHERTAKIHDRLARGWDDRGRPDLATYERELAEYERRGAELANRRPRL